MFIVCADRLIPAGSFLLIRSCARSADQPARAAAGSAPCPTSTMNTLVVWDPYTQRLPCLPLDSSWPAPKVVPASLWRDGHCERIELAGLSDDEAGELLETMLGRAGPG